MLGTVIGYTYTNFMVLLHSCKSVHFRCIYCLLVIPFCPHAVRKIVSSCFIIYIDHMKVQCPCLLFDVSLLKSDCFYSFILQWYKLWLWFLYSVVFVRTVLVMYYAVFQVQ